MMRGTKRTTPWGGMWGDASKYPASGWTFAISRGGGFFAEAVAASKALKRALRMESDKP